MSSRPAMESGVDHQLVRAVLAPLLGDDGLDESLRRCVTAVAEPLDAAFAGVWIVSRSGDTVDLRASAGARSSIGAWPVGSR